MGWPPARRTSPRQRPARGGDCLLVTLPRTSSVTKKALPDLSCNKLPRDPIILLLPLPPSANVLWRKVGKKMVISEAYKAWKLSAGWEAKAQLVGILPIMGAFAVTIELPPGRVDLDNYVKPLLDLCQSAGAIANDKHNAEMHVYRMERDGVLVTLAAL